MCIEIGSTCPEPCFVPAPASSASRRRTEDTGTGNPELDTVKLFRDTVCEI